MYGYGGQILTVDLTSGEVTEEPLAEETARLLLGGNGLAAKILFERVPAHCDPFAPENMIVFAVGPITDTLVPGNSRACVAAKSPLTHLFFDSTFGGRFPATFKRTGYDAVCLVGHSPAPVYLVLDESGLQIKPADGMWGRDTAETAQAVISREGEVDVMAIGPAGEHRVRFASMAHYWKNREGLSGRGGIGAVMGAKNVKAIAVRGTRKTEMAGPAALKALVDEAREDLKKGTAALSTFGTPFLVNPVNALGALGTRNNQTEVCPGADAVSGETFKEKHLKRDTTCLKCPVACGKTDEVREGEHAGLVAKMPEYETIYALGTMTAALDPVMLIRANDLCDKLGMDTITMGVTIAFAMECAERGLLSEERIGRALRFGDAQAVLDLVRMTATREGVGDLLAEGSVGVARHLSPEAERYLYAVKGLELPAHSARALKGMSIGYATGTRGGSHHDTRPTPQYAPDFDRRSPQDKPAFAIRSQHFTAVDDSLVLCRFTSERGGYGMFLNEKYARMVNAVTGWGVSVEELERIGERICTLERLFNVREGISRKDDVLPYRVMHEPIPEGASAGMHCPPEELDRMLDEYYALRGWSQDGIPTVERLEALGLAPSLLKM